MKKHVLALAATLLLSGYAAAATAPTAAAATTQAPIVIKFGTAVKDDTPKGQAVLKFKELAEKYTNGRVQIEAGNDNKLGSQKDEIADMRANKVQMIAPALSKVDELFKSPDLNPYAAIDVPYLFDKTDVDFQKWTDSPIAVDMAKTLAGSGGQPLGYWDNGFKMLSSNKALTKPADFRGLSFRTQSSVVIYKQFKEWGAQPRETGFGDMYASALYGVIDGAENPPSNFNSTKMYQTQKYLYSTYHAPLSYVVLVNTKFWNGLPQDIRKQLEKALKETTTFERASAKRDNIYALQHVQETGLVRVLPPTPELNMFLHRATDQITPALSPLQKEYYDKIKSLLKQ